MIATGAELRASVAAAELEEKAEKKRQRAAFPPLKPGQIPAGELRIYEAPLGNNVSRVSPPPIPSSKRAKGDDRKSKKNRRLRYFLRETARKLTPHENVASCGRVRVPFSGKGEHSAGVVLVKKGDRAFFSGLERCGSVWECPVCMQGIAMRRGEEIRTVQERHRAAGGSSYLLTLTLPHDEGDDLEPMRRAVARAWQYVIAGAPYKRTKKKLELTGSIRALEVTHGYHGFHPHVHVLLLTARSLKPAEILEAETWFFERWRKAITRPDKKTGKRYREPSRENGVKLEHSRKDDYIAKLGLGDEIAKGNFKIGRAGSKTPLEILADARMLPAGSLEQKRAVALWLEYAIEMRGARQHTWSKGLRERYALPEQTDLELSAEPGELEGERLEVFSFSADEWDSIKHDTRALLRILEAAGSMDPGIELDAVIIRIMDEAKGLEPVPF